MNREAGVVQVGMVRVPVALAPYVYLLRVLTHPLRLEALQALAYSADYPRSLAGVLNRHEATVSHHLGALEGAGLVRREQNGKISLYQLTPSVGARTERDNVVLQFTRGGNLLLQLYLPPASREESIQVPRPKMHGRVRRRER